MDILVINGPNLNMLGRRDRTTYGSFTYDDLINKLEEKASTLNLELDFFQSNVEGEIINKIHESLDSLKGIIINPGAYTHYSYAIRDALDIFEGPIIEVHISNIYKREVFRQSSVIAPVATGQIAGFGLNGYLVALDLINEIIV